MVNFKGWNHQNPPGFRRLHQKYKNSRELITKKAEFEKRKFSPARKHFLWSKKAIWRTIVGRGTSRFLFKGKIALFSKKWEFLNDFVQKPSNSFNFGVTQAQKLGCDRFIRRVFMVNFKGWNHQNSAESTRIQETSSELQEFTRINHQKSRVWKTKILPSQKALFIKQKGDLADNCR